VDVAVVALQRDVACGMAILAARRGENFVDAEKSLTGGFGIRPGRSARSACSGCEIRQDECG